MAGSIEIFTITSVPSTSKSSPGDHALGRVNSAFEKTEITSGTDPDMAQVNGLLNKPPDDDNPSDEDVNEKLDTEVVPERETWGSKADFLLSIIGFAVDLANVWRFPYLCYKNGGGAFLIPYLMMAILGAIPLLFMELLLGQYHKQGAISLWKIVPIFKGVGWTIVTVSFTVSFYYNTIIAWSLYYFFASFTLNLPYISCDNEWNTCLCWTGDKTDGNTTDIADSKAYKLGCYNDSSEIENRGLLVHPSTEFFERGMLKIDKSSGFSDLGVPTWDVTLCLLLAYTIIYFSIFKSVKFSGKVVYVTAVVPYVILLILFIRGLFLDGAIMGLKYFVKPDLTRLQDPTVWIDAAMQVFYSVGAGFGVHLAMASYNKFDNNCYLDSIVTASVNSLTSIFSGCTVFVYLGYMSVTMGKPIEKVASDGPSLVFEVYPQAIATLPAPTLWALLFFFMLILLGMDSSMGGLESVGTGIIDEFGATLKKYRFHREFFMLGIVLTSLLFSLASVTQGGFFVFRLLDSFAAGTSLLLVVFFEAVAVGWFYGLDQFSRDAKLMLGFTPGIYWRICWKFISPVFLMGIVIASFVVYEPLEVTLSTGTYKFPTWGNMIGWSLVFLAVLWVPAVATYTLFFKYAHIKSWKTRWALAISPESEHSYITGGRQPQRFKLQHWISLGYKSSLPLANYQTDGEAAINMVNKEHA
ncbi:sodium-dependent dopamine transporter-like [Watersipora subatra]|uniref:sodium-dependent dopamine transporter-like n=1 Tax=Watersipora subatra TaxID=2589382 RepID=UPI00355BE9CE